MAVSRVLSPHVAQRGAGGDRQPAAGEGDCPCQGEDRRGRRGYPGEPACGRLPAGDPDAGRGDATAAPAGGAALPGRAPPDPAQERGAFDPACPPDPEVPARRSLQPARAGVVAGQPLPEDEREAIARHVRELDRLGEDLAGLDRAIAESAIEDTNIDRLLTITGVSLTVAAGLMAAIGDIARAGGRRRPSMAVRGRLHPARSPWAARRRFQPTRHSSPRGRPRRGRIAPHRRRVSSNTSVRGDLRPVPGGECLVGEDVGLGLVHVAAELGELLAQAVGDPAPLALRRLGGLLGEGGAEEEGDRLPPAPGGMRLHLAPEVHPASLPGGREPARDRRLDPLVRVRDDEFDPVEPATDQAAEELGPRRRRLGGADLEPEHLALTPLVDPVSRFAAKPIISRRKSPSAAFATSACRSIISSVSGNLQSGLVSTTPILPERPGDRRAPRPPTRARRAPPLRFQGRRPRTVGSGLSTPTRTGDSR